MSQHNSNNQYHNNYYPASEYRVPRAPVYPASPRFDPRDDGHSYERDASSRRYTPTASPYRGHHRYDPRDDDYRYEQDISSRRYPPTTLPDRGYDDHDRPDSHPEYRGYEFTRAEHHVYHGDQWSPRYQSHRSSYRSADRATDGGRTSACNSLYDRPSPREPYRQRTLSQDYRRHQLPHDQLRSYQQSPRRRDPMPSPQRYRQRTPPRDRAPRSRLEQPNPRVGAPRRSEPVHGNPAPQTVQPGLTSASVASMLVEAMKAAWANALSIRRKPIILPDDSKAWAIIRNGLGEDAVLNMKNLYHAAVRDYSSARAREASQRADTEAFTT